MELKKLMVRKVSIFAFWIMLSMVIIGICIFMNNNIANFDGMIQNVKFLSVLLLFAELLGLILPVVMLFNFKKAYSVNKVYANITAIIASVLLILFIIPVVFIASVSGGMLDIFSIFEYSQPAIKALFFGIVLVLINGFFQLFACRFFFEKTIKEKNNVNFKNIVNEEPVDSEDQSIDLTKNNIEKSNIISEELVESDARTTDTLENIEVDNDVKENIVNLQKNTIKKTSQKSTSLLRLPQLSSTPLITLYDLMNKNNIKNRVDSSYWIYQIESKIIKQEDGINKRFVKVCFFNRNMNENDNLMRLYLKINNEHIYQERFEIVPEYKDVNILYFIIERDLSEEYHDVEIESYIIDGKKVDIEQKYIDKIEVHDTIQKRNVLIEKYFKGRENQCLTVPVYEKNYWICICGRWHENSEEVCGFCHTTKNQIKEYIHVKAEDLLIDIQDRIQLDTTHTIDEIIYAYKNFYYENYGIDPIHTNQSIDRDMLEVKQEKLVMEKVENYIQSQPIKFNPRISFKENIERYCHVISNNVILPNFIFNKLDLDKCQYLYEQKIQDYHRKKEKLKKYGVVVGGFILIIIVGRFVFNIASNHLLPQKNVDTSEQLNVEDEKTIEEDNFELIVSNYTIPVGGTKQIEYYGNSVPMIMKSSNENVVTVTQDGYLQGVSVGDATIQITSSISDYNQTVLVKVIDNKPSGEYIIADSSERLLAEDDLINLSTEQLRLARNEIYARHGCVFNDESLQSYFDNCSWYVPQNIKALDANDSLSEIEKTNTNFIRDYEERRNQ